MSSCIIVCAHNVIIMHKRMYMAQIGARKLGWMINLMLAQINKRYSTNMYTNIKFMHKKVRCF